jgi:hypothetical protein
MVAEEEMPPTIIDVISYEHVDDFLDIIHRDMEICIKIREKTCGNMK